MRLFGITFLLFTSFVLSAGILADFTSKTPAGTTVRHGKGTAKLQNEAGKQFLRYTGVNYGEVHIKPLRKVNFANEFVAEANLIIPENKSVLAFALHFVDARGKTYIFTRDIRNLSPGNQTVLYKFAPDAKTADSISKKNGPMQFPIYFRGFGLLFKKQAENVQSSLGIRKIVLTKGEDDPSPVVQSAGILADFTSKTPAGTTVRHGKGTAKLQNEAGKQFLRYTGVNYGEVHIKPLRKVNFAKEFVAEANLIIPENKSVLAFALHFIDARGKTYIFTRDIRNLSPGNQTVLYKFAPDAKTADSISKKNGPMQFPIYFRGFGLLFKKQAENVQSSLGIRKIVLVKGEDDLSTAWLSVGNKILFPDPLHHNKSYLHNGKMKMGDDALQMSFVKVKNIFETAKRNNTYSEIYKIKLDLNLKSGMVSATPFIIDAAKKKFFCTSVPLKSGRHTYSFEVKTNKVACAPFNFGIEFVSKDGKSEVDLYDVSLNVPMRTVDAFSVGKTPQTGGLILPDTKDKQASISFKSNLEIPVQADIKLVLRDSFQTLKTENHKFTFAPGETKTFRMPEMKRNGIYYIDYQITLPGKQGIRKGQNSFVVLQPSGPASEKNPFIFGVSHHSYRFPLKEFKVAVRILSSIGINGMRDDVGLEGEANKEFDFSWYDVRKQLLEKEKIRTMACMKWCPSRAVNKNWVPFVPKERSKYRWWPGGKLPDYNEYRKWVHAWVKYAGKNLAVVETWNEPELIGFGNFSPTECAELQKIVYTEVKKTAPGIIVSTPGFVCARPRAEFTDPQYMEKMLAASKGFYDAIAHHGHDPFDIYQMDIKYLLDMKKKLGIEKIPWIAGETAIHLKSNEYEQGMVLFKKLNFAYANGCIGYFWYDLKNDGFDPLNAEHTFGLFTYDFQPKAVFAFYNTLTSALKCAKFEKNLSADGVSMYRFNSGKQFVYTFWNDSDITPERLFWLTGKKAEFSDVFGNKSYPEGLMTFSMHPGILRVEKNGSADPVPVWKLNQARFNPDKSAFVSLTFRNPFAKELEMRVNGKIFKVAGKNSKTVQFDRVKVEKTGKIVLPFEIPSMKYKSQIGVWPKTAYSIPLAGFRTVPDLKIDQPGQMNRLTVNAPGMHNLWRNKNDFSADVYFGRTQSSLLMKCVVTDDIHHQPHKGGDVWRADNLQLLLLVPGQKNSWEIGFTCLRNGQPEVFCWSKGDYNAPVNLIRLKTKRDESRKQTVYEAEIPWKALGLTKTPSFLKFNLICNENDGTVRKIQATAFGNSKDCKEPNKFHVLNFQ